jgi:hypothetical protein
MRFIRSAVAIAALAFAGAAQALTFTPGHFYTSGSFFDPATITQINGSGAAVSTLTISTSVGEQVRGLAFGPDGLLYATVVRGSGGAVVALDASGAVRQSYPFNAYVFGNGSYGKLAVDDRHIYVAGPQLLAFDVGSPASLTTVRSDGPYFDVEMLPSGNLLAMSSYQLREIATSGLIVRTFGADIVDGRGVEFDPATDKIFTTELGQTGAFFRVSRLNAATGLIEQTTNFNYADDLFVTSAGDLAIGSRTQTTRRYSQSFLQTGTLGSEPQSFVTQFVPEPASATLLGMTVPLLARRRQSRD